MSQYKTSTTDLVAGLENVSKSLSEIGKSNDREFLAIEDDVNNLIQHLLAALFPYHFGSVKKRFVDNEKRTWELMRCYDALMACFMHVISSYEECESRALEIISSLPGILEVLYTDVQAGYEGDPAAKSIDEVILTYPAFKAIAIHRVAHRMYELGIPLIPRFMSEYAHTITGIDIHPGATIGRYFFIDHGTGVVIGETTVIGEHVKLYQHVTLGAKSFAVKEDGTLVKGIKRHPNIGDRVVVYSGATILGGDTNIGNDCVVGGNVWLTHSLNDGETIVYSDGRSELR